MESSCLNVLVGTDSAKAFKFFFKKNSELVACAVRRNRSGSPRDSLSHLSSEGYLTSGRGASCGIPNLPRLPERSTPRPKAETVKKMASLSCVSDARPTFSLHTPVLKQLLHRNQGFSSLFRCVEML